MSAAKQYSYRDWEPQSTLETGEPEPVEDYPSESRVVSGTLWMIGVSIAIYFLPVANGLIAGTIGGYRIGSPRAALMSALGAVAFTSCLLWMMFTLIPFPMMGNPITQIGAFGLIFLTDIGLIVGAGIGGVVARNKIDRLNRA